MNKKQIEVQKSFLDDEEAVLASLEKTYKQSLNEINAKSKELQKQIEKLQMGLLNGAMSDEEKEQMQSMIRSKVYQKKYQDSLKKQVSGILDDMHKKSYKTISSYLDGCYKEGFLGALYDMQGQGVPMFFPMDQEAMVKAVQLDSKISKGLYSSIGEDVANLKKTITATVSRGIATGSTYSQIAQQIKGKMVGVYDKVGGSLYRAETIARTEGHRIQVQSAMDACHKAKGKGADVLKQWDSTMDSATRESHVAVDGEIRELDKPFSNGLMFPGDPSGGAGEVVNCRCALLQRARWALDDGELETLKERAAYFGIDKSDSFEDFKKKYLNATTPEPVKPKKEYLTEKKLQQYLDDGQNQLKDLEQQFKTESGGWTYDEAIDDFGSLEDFTDGDNLKLLKSIKKQSDDLQKQMDEWQEKLDKKIVAKETKKLKKEQILLQDELDAFDVKTYSGIWKDDVTTADWGAKQHAIQAKHDYFESKWLNATPPEQKKWEDYLSALHEFDDEGKKYYEIQQKLNKTKADLKKLQKNGKITPNDAFSQDRKDNALWFDRAHGGFSAADSYFDPKAKAIHNACTPQERSGFYTYTSSSGGHNRPLAGFQKPWSEYGSGWEEQFYVGSGKVWIDFEGKGDAIRGLTTLIEKSTYDDDVWLQSGQGFATLEGFLGIKYGSLSRMSDTDLQQFVGRRNIFHQFLSSAVNEGGGSMFNEKPMKFNIYAPKGSQMLYASDVGAFGKGENEMILQRGGTYEITKIYWGNDATDGNRRKIFVDMELHPEVGYDLFQQDPSEWKGSRKNYQS